MAGTGKPTEPPLLVHGLGREMAAPDWPPLADDEVRDVLQRGFGPDASAATVVWRSPRPLSAAGLVRLRHRTVFVKRHHVRVRTAEQLGVEHALAAHLQGQGLAVPALLAPPAQVRDFVYEVHAKATGLDAYREEASWTPFRSLGHARAAGAALARFHQAAIGFSLPERPPGILVGSCALVLAPDPLEALTHLARQRPGLARSLAAYPWQEDFTRHLVGPARLAAHCAGGLQRAWGHCDWHPSNLTWTSGRPDGDVAEVIDLGLANLTFAAHDLAVALERSTISWLDLAEGRTAEAGLGAVDALIDGYEAVRPLSPAEVRALPELLPVAHVEYALSEVEYYGDVVGSAANADIAYRGYLLGHARWFEGPQGSALIEHLRRRAARAQRSPRRAARARRRR